MGQGVHASRGIPDIQGEPSLLRQPGITQWLPGNVQLQRPRPLRDSGAAEAGAETQRAGGQQGQATSRSGNPQRRHLRPQQRPHSGLRLCSGPTTGPASVKGALQTRRSPVAFSARQTQQAPGVREREAVLLLRHDEGLDTFDSWSIKRENTKRAKSLFFVKS